MKSGKQMSTLLCRTLLARVVKRPALYWDEWLFIHRMLFIRLFGILGLLIGLTALTVGCSAFPERSNMINSEPDFVGFITEIQPGGSEGVLGRILIESHANKLVDRYIVTVTSDTLIFKRDGEDHHPANFDMLEVRHWVEVWFVGPVKKSFPAQATAQQVVIFKIYK